MLRVGLFTQKKKKHLVLVYWSLVTNFFHAALLLLLLLARFLSSCSIAFVFVSSLLFYNTGFFSGWAFVSHCPSSSSSSCTAFQARESVSFFHRSHFIWNKRPGGEGKGGTQCEQVPSLVFLTHIICHTDDVGLFGSFWSECVCVCVWLWEVAVFLFVASLCFHVLLVHHITTSTAAVFY